MLASVSRESMLDWLQLSPTLLSRDPAHAAGPVAVVEAPPAVVAIAQPDDGGLHRGLITADSVAPGKGMVFLTSEPTRSHPGEAEPWQTAIRTAYPAGGRAYDPMESGGTQSVALAEMTRYLATRS